MYVLTIYWRIKEYDNNCMASPVCHLQHICMISNGFVIYYLRDGKLVSSERRINSEVGILLLKQGA